MHLLSEILSIYGSPDLVFLDLSQREQLRTRLKLFHTMTFGCRDHGYGLSQWHMTYIVTSSLIGWAHTQPVWSLPAHRLSHSPHVFSHSSEPSSQSVSPSHFQRFGMHLVLLQRYSVVEHVVAAEENKRTDYWDAEENNVVKTRLTAIGNVTLMSTGQVTEIHLNLRHP